MAGGLIYAACTASNVFADEPKCLFPIRSFCHLNKVDWF